MSTTISTPSMAIGKRKRPVVSYAGDDDLGGLLGDMKGHEANGLDQSSGDESGNDDRTYSTRKRATKKKASPRKRAKMTSARTARDTKPFPFMDLPPELRDMIYDMVLTDPNGASLVSKTKACRRTVRRGRIYSSDDGTYWYGRRRLPSQGAEDNASKTTSLVPNILALSKQIRDEAINYLYNQDFIFEDTVALHRFLATIGHRNQQRLLNIEIKAFASGRRTIPVNHCAFALLAGATNLKSLKIGHHQGGYYRSPVNHAQGLYRTTHFFLEAYGDVHGRRDAGVDIIELPDDDFDRYYRRRLPAAHEDWSAAQNEEAFQKELRRLLGVK